MKWTYKPFLGLMPRLEPYLLPRQNGTKALDVRLETGALKPLRLPTFLVSLAKPGAKKTIYRYGKDVTDPTLHWFHWNEDVDVTVGPVLDDPTERIYFTGDGPPKYTNALIATEGAIMPTNAYLLGIPTPTKPDLLALGTITDGSDPVTMVVAYSFVAGGTDPGPPSPVSNSIEYVPGQHILIQGLDGVPSGQRDITHRRLWVAQTDAFGATVLRFWRDIPVGIDSATGPVDFTNLGEEVDSPVLAPPPDDLHSLALHPNGFFVGASGRRFIRSEIFRAYGWPDAYQDPMAYDIVGLAVFGQGVAICTTNLTYFAYGSDPQSLSIVNLAGNHPCASKRTIKAMQFGVIYVSDDGLVLVSGTGPLSLVSDPFFERDQWLQYNPSSMHSVAFGNQYIVWWERSSSDRGGIIFEFDRSGNIGKVSETSIYATAAYFDGKFSTLNVSLPNDTNVHVWDNGTNMSFYWAGREERMDRPQNVGAARVRARQYPVKFRFYGDDKLINEVIVTDETPFTLSSRDRYRRFVAEVEGVHDVTEVEVGSSVLELLADDQ